VSPRAPRRAARPPHTRQVPTDSPAAGTASRAACAATRPPHHAASSRPTLLPPMHVASSLCLSLVHQTAQQTAPATARSAPLRSPTRLLALRASCQPVSANLPRQQSPQQRWSPPWPPHQWPPPPWPPPPSPQAWLRLPWPPHHLLWSHHLPWSVLVLPWSVLRLAWSLQVPAWSLLVWPPPCVHAEQRRAAASRHAPPAT
jgi:hypothetical protein